MRLQNIQEIAIFHLIVHTFRFARSRLVGTKAPQKLLLFCHRASFFRSAPMMLTGKGSFLPMQCQRGRPNLVVVMICSLWLLQLLSGPVACGASVSAASASGEFPDYYLALGFVDPVTEELPPAAVVPSPTDAEIQRAFKRRALQFHPDKNPSAEAASLFRILATARATLLHHAYKRQEYDDLYEQHLAHLEKQWMQQKRTKKAGGPSPQSAVVFAHSFTPPEFNLRAAVEEFENSSSYDPKREVPTGRAATSKVPIPLPDDMMEVDVEIDDRPDWTPVDLQEHESTIQRQPPVEPAVMQPPQSVGVVQESGFLHLLGPLLFLCIVGFLKWTMDSTEIEKTAALDLQSQNVLLKAAAQEADRRRLADLASQHCQQQIADRERKLQEAIRKQQHAQRKRALAEESYEGSVVPRSNTTTQPSWFAQLAGTGHRATTGMPSASRRGGIIL